MATKLYENIKGLCDKQKTSISNLETSAGLPPGTIGNWKTERRWMIYLCGVAKKLNVSIDQLFFGEAATPAQEKQDALEKVISALACLELDDKSADAIIDISKIIVEKFSHLKDEERNHAVLDPTLSHR